MLKLSGGVWKSVNCITTFAINPVFITLHLMLSLFRVLLHSVLYTSLPIA